MFSANGDYLIKSFETFNTIVPDELIGVSDAPIISDEEIENAQNILNSNKKLDKIKSLEIGSLFHKKIRNIIRPYLKPGLKLSQLANIIESTCKSLTNNKGINKGIGFPSSLSVNECAAHFTPSKEYDIILDKNSITKIDFGVEINGWITDCAFTIAFNEDYKNLLDGVKDATNHGIKIIGIDQDIGEWGGEISEIMESYEVLVDGKETSIIPIKNLGGHNILKNNIHGGIFLPSSNIYNGYLSLKPRFTENVYAIETFGSTKSAYVKEHYNENTIYMKNNKINSKISDKFVKIYDILNKTFGSIPFCDRYLETYNVFNDLGLSEKKKLGIFKNVTMDYFDTNNIIKTFPPLYCSKKGMTAQYEHTIYLDEKKKIVFTSSSDY